VIVACTQCLQGRVSLGVYETGSALAQAGVIGGGDMTPEAALTKLSVLLGRGLDPQQVRELMQVNLVGELTPEGFV
jgi:L-asparaginase/Glu-tRNA(Gln) amidotransferase subunit D